MIDLLLHLQEVPVDQHHLEHRFYLEDPENNKNISEKGPKIHILVLFY